MKLISRTINKFVQNIGERNVPYACMVILIIFLTIMALTVNHGLEKAENRYENQTQSFEENLKSLDEIDKALDEIRKDLDKVNANAKDIKHKIDELKIKERIKDSKD